MSPFSSSVRFIHAADLHLGIPLRMVGEPGGRIKERVRNATYIAFSRIVEAAIKYDVDFVVFSGDMYDAEARSVQANRFAVEQLKRLDEADIRTYITYGNHDPLGERDELLQLPRTVTVFGSESVEMAIVQKENLPVARVLGQSYRNRAESRRLYQGFVPPDAGVPNIAMLHTALDPASSRYVPGSVDDLLTRDGIHYWALGHLHTVAVLHGENPCVAYPGTPQGCDVGEPGLKGCLLVELSAGGQTNLHFIPTSEIVWLDELVDLDELDVSETTRNLDDVTEVLVERASKLADLGLEDWQELLPVPILEPHGLPSGYLVRWTVTGHSPVQRLIEDSREAESHVASQLREAFRDGSPFVWTTDVRLRIAEPLPDVKEFMGDDPVLIELERLLEEAISDAELQRKVREVCGQLWYTPFDHEEKREDAFALTERRLEELIRAAGDRIKLRVLMERMQNVD